MNWRGGQGLDQLNLQLESRVQQGLNYHDTCDRTLIKTMLSVPYSS